jgi:hypothetical protein
MDITQTGAEKSPLASQVFNAFEELEKLSDNSEYLIKRLGIYSEVLESLANVFSSEKNAHVFLKKNIINAQKYSLDLSLFFEGFEYFEDLLLFILNRSDLANKDCISCHFSVFLQIVLSEIEWIDIGLKVQKTVAEVTKKIGDTHSNKICKCLDLLVDFVVPDDEERRVEIKDGLESSLNSFSRLFYYYSFFFYSLSFYQTPCSLKTVEPFEVGRITNQQRRDCQVRLVFLPEIRTPRHLSHCGADATRRCLATQRHNAHGHRPEVCRCMRTVARTEQGTAVLQRGGLHCV